MRPHLARRLGRRHCLTCCIVFALLVRGEKLDGFVNMRRNACLSLHPPEVPSRIAARGFFWRGKSQNGLPSTLRAATVDILNRLREEDPQVVEGVDPRHELPPFIPKAVWDNLGDLVRERETQMGILPNTGWTTLRLDGCGWSTMLKQLRASGVLKPGFNSLIAEQMGTICRKLMINFRAVLGYTHSDELTVIIPPGERVFGGCTRKWVSIAASTATAESNRQFLKVAAEANISFVDLPLSTFDCRVGTFRTESEATSLLLWRASDCTKNAASDGVMHLRGSARGNSRLVRRNTVEKLRHLTKVGALPMPRHQAYGSLFALQSALGEPNAVLVNTGANDTSAMHLLNLARRGTLLPEALA
eukprot:1893530-Amphidinium_carterae.1